jgi:Dockerin type I domain
VVVDPANWRMSDPVSTGSFLVTAVTTSGEKIEAQLPHAWQNLLRAGDVNNDGVVSASDALRIINELGRRDFSDSSTQALLDPLTVSSWPGVYFDHNGDDRVTALDALRVINDLTRITPNNEHVLVDSRGFNKQQSRDIVQETRHESHTEKAAFFLVPKAPAALLKKSQLDLAHKGTPDLEPVAVDQLLADQDFVDQLLE